MGLGKAKMITHIEQVRMILLIRIVSVRVGVMARHRLEVIDICNLVTRGFGKRTSNLITQSYTFKRSMTITTKGEST